MSLLLRPRRQLSLPLTLKLREVASPIKGHLPGLGLHAIPGLTYCLNARTLGPPKSLKLRILRLAPQDVGRSREELISPSQLICKSHGLPRRIEREHIIA